MTIREIIKHIQDTDTFAQHLGIELIETEDGRCVAVMPCDKRHRNNMGHVHGGAIFALADMAFAGAAITTGVRMVTAQSSISYLKPATGPLRGEGKALHVGRKLSTFEILVSDNEKKLIAQALFTGGTVGEIPARN